MTNQIFWKDWTCDLHNDHMCLADVHATLPGNDAAEIHWLIRLLERPASPLALSGAIDLFPHDCVHILLGRGLLPQDEAFVLGFTMGAASNVRWWEPHLFKFAAHRLYPKIYRLSQHQLRVFDLAFAFARQSKCRDIHKFDFAAHKGKTLGKLRAMCHIDTTKLSKLFREEQKLCPNSKESQRLDIRGWDQAAVLS